MDSLEFEDDSKSSPQLRFAKWLSVQANYKTKDGVIFKYVGTHWQAQNVGDTERVAFNWLAKHAPAKASEKTAVSCVASAVMYLSPIPAIERDQKIVKIPVLNGTLHIETEGTSMHDSSPEDGLTHCVSCRYLQDAPRGMFMDYLRSSLPDDDVKNFVQEYVGYTLISDTRHQFALWLVGDGGTGKGTFCEMVAALHGKSRVASMKIGVGQLQGFNLSALLGASLVLVDETPQRIDEQSIKTLISGDLTSADRKYRDVVSFKPTAKWLICGNGMPSFSDQTNGVWRRFAIVPFDVKSRAVPLLAESIILNELPGVLNWAVEGLERLLARGRFAELPEQMRVRKEQARIENDSVVAWREDVCPVVAEQSGGGMPRCKIYQSYSLFCLSNGLKSVSSIKFWQRLQTAYPGLIEFRRGTERTRCANLLVP